jgi:hypothetical protein
MKIERVEDLDLQSSGLTLDKIETNAFSVAHPPLETSSRRNGETKSALPSLVAHPLLLWW